MKKNTKIAYDISINIGANIVAAIFLSLFINPISNWIIPKLLYISSKFSNAFIDFVYKRASHITVESTSTLNLMISIMILFYVFIAIKYLLSYQMRRLYTLYDDLLFEFYSETSDSENNNIDSKNDDDVSDDVSIEESISKIKSKIHLLKAVHSRLLRSSLFLIFLMYLSTMLQIYISGISSRTLSNIEIVSPYVSDNEYKQFKSDFYTINGKSDYDVLYEKLDSVAKSNSLKLK